MSSIDRNIRKVYNSKSDNSGESYAKGVLKNVPSRQSMSEGEQAFVREPNKPLALYKKNMGRLSKVYLSDDGNQVIDRDLKIKGDIIAGGNLQLNNIPIFEATAGSTQSDIAIGGSGVQLLFSNENIDTANAYASSIYTVPISGYYHIYYNLTFDAFDTGMTFAIVAMRITAGGSDSYEGVTRIDDKEFSADTDNHVSKSCSKVLKLSIDTTIKILYYQDGGTAQVDMLASNTSLAGPPRESVFGGYLISKY